MWNKKCIQIKNSPRRVNAEGYLKTNIATLYNAGVEELKRQTSGLLKCDRSLIICMNNMKNSLF